MEAAYEHRTVRVPDMAAETRWPLFARRATEAGAKGMLSIQLWVEGDDLGALNLYSYEANAFTDESENIGLLVASHAAVAFAEAEKSRQLHEAIDTYTLRRNPFDRSDPMNLAHPDEQTRRAIKDVPSRPRPGWLVEQVKRMRYPKLWDTVRPTWHRDAFERTSVRSVLVDHVNYILVNQYRQELGLSDNPWDQPALAVTGLMVTGRGQCPRQWS